MRGDLGYSYVQKTPVTTLIKERLPATIELAVAALIFSLHHRLADRNIICGLAKFTAGSVEHGRRLPGNFHARLLAGDYLDFDLRGEVALAASAGTDRF